MGPSALRMRLVKGLNLGCGVSGGGPSHGAPYESFFLFSCTGSQRRRSSKTLEENHNANLRPLGVLYHLLVVEWHGAHPRSTGMRTQVRVCSADAGVCHAWQGAGEMSNNNCKSVNHKRCHLGEVVWHMSRRGRYGYYMCGVRVHSAGTRARSPHSTLPPLCPYSWGWAHPERLAKILQNPGSNCGASRTGDTHGSAWVKGGARGRQQGPVRDFWPILRILTQNSTQFHDLRFLP